jgi:hypothetical protein
MNLRNLLVGTVAALALTISPVFAAPNTSGAIYTTESTCDGTNINIFSAKTEVYLDGGPTHPGAAGLDDGNYYVQVTEPDGTVLGKTLFASVVVEDGEFAECYQLAAILQTASSGFLVFGYDTTSNSGGEYKVWISTDSTFTNSQTKTDNFKVLSNNPNPTPNPTPNPSPTPQPEAILHVEKFYDANANGSFDLGESFINGWRMLIENGISLVRYTPVTVVVEPGEYSVTESTPIELSWVHTTDNPVTITLQDGDEETVRFGNVCVGEGGGHTKGYWSNKNGQATMNDGGTLAPELALLSSLNLRNATGAAFDPASYAAFRTWLTNANAINMAYMLSAQLAAMELNVESGMVQGDALVYAPGVPGASGLGFISINDLMDEANATLGADGLTLSGDPNRAPQAALKNALDAANNNTIFVQATPCAFSFAEN